MTKVSKKFIDPERFGDYVNNLWNAFMLMNSKEEIRLLFKDLLTPTEFKMFAKRFEIARRLLENQLYEGIQRDLAVTSATIATISNHLAEKGDGFRLAHKKLGEWEEKYLTAQKDRQKDLENPLRSKIRQNDRTLLGTALKVTLSELDKKMSKTFKERSLKKKLTL